MKDLHSIWLMPEAGTETVLKAIVGELAARFDAPRFQPHLTLVEDQRRSLHELMPLVEAVAAGRAEFAMPVKEIGTSELYFRSFYALFDAIGPLLELKRRVIEMISPSLIDDFMPHISLLYGVADCPERQAAQADIGQHLVGAQIHFDRICVVASAKEIPIDKWAIRSSTGLQSYSGAQPARPAAWPSLR